MSEGYPFATLEPKWQAYWDEHATFRAEHDADKPKFYVLDMFPYPSGAGLHVGHPEGYTATDILSRYKRMRGFNVLHPMGWDAFGLPAENYAIKTGIHPSVVTRDNIATFKRQIKMLGFSYDWSREVATTDTAYYKWTQWIFLKLFEAGLAYQANVPINWCPSCKTGLANEEVKGGLCDRCGNEVGRKDLTQWILRITDYAEKLLEGLDDLDWSDSIKLMQENWIGRSEGADVVFALADPPEGVDPEIVVYTTRPDTLFGATYMVLAPEHPLVDALTTAVQRDAVTAYVEEARSKSDLQRTELAKDKTGVFSGAYAINPVNDARIPIWIADYVLMSYGTGAIMAVPAHDQRDFEFATKFEIPIITVVAPTDGSTPPEGAAFEGEGIAVSSGLLDGLTTAEAKKRIVDELEAKGKATAKVRYRLRDWIFSRQRYWGEPIPIVHCPDCGPVGVPEAELPLTLPEVDKYEPTGTGESPLAAIEEWVTTTCPKCGGPGRRETNTMPQWAGSCWYYLRYIDPDNDEQFVDPEKERYWMPVDLYLGGAEHAVLHLMYARFWHRFLYDIGVVSTPEPFAALRNQGMILGYSYRCFRDEHGALVPSTEAKVDRTEGERYVHERTGGLLLPVYVTAGEAVWRDEVAYHPDDPSIALEEVTEKMSKSRGNVVNPDDVVSEFGADAMRLYEMFMGPLEVTKPWSTSGIRGVKRFLDKVWNLTDKELVDEEAPEDLTRLVHKTVKKVTDDLEGMKFNTAISAMMILANDLGKRDRVPKEVLGTLTLLLSPFAPHLAEEIWERLGHEPSTSGVEWPRYDEKLTIDDRVTLVVQVNGKVRDNISVARNSPRDELQEIALSSEKIVKWIEGKEIKKVIVVPNKLVNLVVR